MEKPANFLLHIGMDSNFFFATCILFHKCSRMFNMFHFQFPSWFGFCQYFASSATSIPHLFFFKKKSSSRFSVPFDIRYINTYNRCNAFAFAINSQYENPEGFKMKLVGVVFITKAEILHFSS